MLLPRYCVAVMDNWTPIRRFWTFAAAKKFAAKHPGYAYIYLWASGRWEIN